MMEAAFSSIGFADAARAETNLQLIEQRLPGSLWAALPGLLAQVPDPDGALNYLERYLRGAAPRLVNYLARYPAGLHYLLVVFSYSRYLSESLIQQPDLITWLHRPGRNSLQGIKSADDLHEEFARFEATAFDLPAAVLLARFKRREYLRIMLRDVLGLATLAETTLELSLLADVLLERALRLCEQKLRNAHGAPQATDQTGRRHSVGLAILSLGKLGGQELNYASDIDLMFLYGQEGETAGGPAGSIANSEYFIRLAQAVLKTISEATPEGAVFRVDLRLRPQGREGDLAVGLAAALDYYRHRAREWELQMLIKARGSAGDLSTARRFLREVQPLIFRQQFHVAAVAAVLNAREELTRKLRRKPRRSAEQWNVKLTPGGIRDIEFLAQCLQRLYGGSDPWLAGAPAASTLVALQRLHDKGYLSGRDFFRLGTAYQFLRRVEHRLQLRDGLQRHTLPEAPDALERLGRRCGVEPSGGRTAGEQLLQRIRQHFQEVREIYERALGSPQPPAQEAEAADGAGALLRRLRREHPALADAITRLGPDPHARRGLDRFLSSAALHPELLGRLAENPSWVHCAAQLFSRSDLIIELLARNPGEISLVCQPEASVPAWAEPMAVTEPMEETMAALRVGYRQRLLRTIARALRGEAKPFETFDAVTGLAEQALRAALLAAAAEAGLATRPAELEQTPFAVLALGRLGAGELDVGSDADLVFVADERLSAEQREPWRRLAERFIHLVSSHTREGLLFPVDARLRPRGTEGEMVQTVGYLGEYFRSEAQGWEAITYLKARPVAGNPGLAAEALARIHSTLATRFPPGNTAATRELARELVHTRQRLETESVETARGRKAETDFKRAAGGFYDVDYLVGFLMQTRGLVQPGHILRQIAALESASALETAQAQTLRSAALLYRSLDHALRLITGHPQSRLPEPALAPRVACLLSQWDVPLAAADSAEGLALAVSSTRAAVRGLYEQIVLAAAESSP